MSFDYAWDEEEQLAQPPNRKPCSECPWRRNSAPGYLGPHTAEEWCAGAHDDGQIACHLTIPSGMDETEPDWPAMTACAGAAIFRANICKSPRPLRNHPEHRLPADRESVFAWDNEFIAHHKRVKP